MGGRFFAGGVGIGRRRVWLEDVRAGWEELEWVGVGYGREAGVRGGEKSKVDGTAAGGRGRGGEGRGHRDMATDLIFPLRSDDEVKLEYMYSTLFGLFPSYR